jgi:hypothetical protein
MARRTTRIFHKNRSKNQSTIAKVETQKKHFESLNKQVIHMCNRNNESFLTLPVELIQCILDKLDLLTILLSFRNVCQRFNLIVDSYNRYKVSFS